MSSKPPEAGSSQDESPRVFARRVLDAEADAIHRVTLDAGFDAAVKMILDASDRHGTLVISGLGKSGHIGQKLSATFASTGTPSHFVNPVEAVHGDLGRIRSVDVVLMLSYSGNTEEVFSLAELLRPDGLPMIAMVGPAGKRS